VVRIVIVRVSSVCNSCWLWFTARLAFRVVTRDNTPSLLRLSSDVAFRCQYCSSLFYCIAQLLGIVIVIDSMFPNSGVAHHYYGGTISLYWWVLIVADGWLLSDRIYAERATPTKMMIIMSLDVDCLIIPFQAVQISSLCQCLSSSSVIFYFWKSVFLLIISPAVRVNFRFISVFVLSLIIIIITIIISNYYSRN